MIALQNPRAGLLSTPLALPVGLNSYPNRKQEMRAVVELLLIFRADPSIPDEVGRLVEEKTTDHEIREGLRRERSAARPVNEIPIGHGQAREGT